MARAPGLKAELVPRSLWELERSPATIFEARWGENDDDGWNCWAKCIYTTAEEGTLPEDAPKVVFLRDPLERLLSAYLNKCEDTFFRLGEKHCEPVEIFGRQYNETDLFGHIEDSHQQMFAAYLDIMPLRWNLHVIPQAFSCDLYR